MNRDIFSVSEAEFLAFATTFNVGAVSYANLLGIPDALVTANTAKLTAYTTAYHAAEAPNAGKIDREYRKERREALTQNIRKIKNAYLDADPLDKVTPEILMDFGLPSKDTTRTDVPDPTEVVPFTLEGGEYLQVVVKHPARPPRYNGAVAFYKVGGSVPETGAGDSEGQRRTARCKFDGLAKTRRLRDTTHSERYMNEFTNIGVGGMLGRFVPIVLKFKNQRPIIKEEFDKEQICC